MDLFPASRWCGSRFVVGALCMAAVGCGPAPSDTLARVRAQGFVRAGYAWERPHAFLGPGGRVEGESPEALRAALGAVGVDSVRWVLMDFGDLIPALRAGRIDVAAGGQFVTAEREALVRFARPTVCTRPALIHRAASPAPGGLGAFVDGSAGALAVLEGSVELQAARDMGVPSERLVVVPDVATGLAALLDGRVEAVALTGPSARLALEDSPSAASLAWAAYEPPAPAARLVAGCSALAFRLADSSFTRVVNGALAGYVGSARHLGVLTDLGFQAANVPEPDWTVPEGGR